MSSSISKLKIANLNLSYLPFILGIKQPFAFILVTISNRLNAVILKERLASFIVNVFLPIISSFMMFKGDNFTRSFSIRIYHKLASLLTVSAFANVITTVNQGPCALNLISVTSSSPCLSITFLIVCLFTFRDKFLNVIDLFLNSSSSLFSIAANLNSLFSSRVILQASSLLSMDLNSAKIYGSDFQYDNLTPKKSCICPTFC